MPEEWNTQLRAHRKKKKNPAVPLSSNTHLTRAAPAHPPSTCGFFLAQVIHWSHTLHLNSDHQHSTRCSGGKGHTVTKSLPSTPALHKPHPGFICSVVIHSAMNACSMSSVAATYNSAKQEWTSQLSQLILGSPLRNQARCLWQWCNFICKWKKLFFI